MSKNNNNFFKEKQIWSEVKDELLGCYLKPYLQKILTTGRPVYYVDCFAGKGKFEDNKPGSPLIALDIINNCLSNTTMRNSTVESCYIDLNYAKELETNLIGYQNINIVSGMYENTILNLLSDKQSHNVFLYIDPYGIKALKCQLFDSFTQLGLNSIEMLINLNSFGLIREACRVKNVQYNDVESFDDIVEYDPTNFDSSLKSRQALINIVGGDYWEQIVDQYKTGQISGYEAEKLFAERYCLRLRQNYRYVLNMPIRLHKGHRPKYRMIHVTNHEDGCVLMYENICKRWQVLEEIQMGGQIGFFDTTVDDELINDNEIAKRVKSHMKKYQQYTKLNIVLAEFFTENGVLCNKMKIIDILHNLEIENQIKVQRNPSHTTTGKPSSFLTVDSKQSVLLKGGK